MELEFVKGRAVVELGNGRKLSVLNSDRNPIIASSLEFSAFLMDAIMEDGWQVHADEGTFEVALMNTENKSLHELPAPNWASHKFDDGDTSWTIYRDVTMEMIEDVVNRGEVVCQPS